jgi:signal transduction histidine kinase
MTSHKPTTSQLTLELTLENSAFEVFNTLQQAIIRDLSLLRKSLSLKNLLPVKSIRLNMALAVTAIQQRQQAIVKVLGALAAAMAVVLFLAFNQNGFAQSSSVIATVAVALNLILFVFIFSGNQKGILQQKVMLEQKNAALEELVAISKEQREKLKKTVSFKEKLISIISHDVRVPLNSFRFLIENYERGYLTDKMVLDGIIETKKDILKVDSMVLDLVNWSTDEKNEAEVVSYQQMHDVMESALSIYTLCAKNKNLDIVPVIDMPEAMNLSVSKREIEIIIRNLMSNAIKFSNQDSQIEVSMKANTENPSMATLSVRDFGTGMHPAVLEKLNGNRVVSTIGTMNEVGLGVGLSIVFDIMHSKNLQHTIQSEAGKGTQFSINIPLVK